MDLKGNILWKFPTSLSYPLEIKIDEFLGEKKFEFTMKTVIKKKEKEDKKEFKGEYDILPQQYGEFSSDYLSLEDKNPFAYKSRKKVYKS